MKRNFIRTLLFIWLTALLAGVGLAQTPPNNLTPIGAALRDGSSRDLAAFLAPTVAVSFSGDTQSYSATQAELVVRDFFAKNTPSGFEFVHQGASDEGIQYAIGRYTSRSGAYRVYIKLKPGKGAPEIDTLDFTKE